MEQSAPKPAELRMILGKNLRFLSEGSESISDICRQIGVNRTQFNRYLNGTSFPRPDILFRICRHFKVDANIMLNPIDQSPSKQLPSSPNHDDLLATSIADRPFDHYLLPDGMYQYWRKSFRQPHKAYQGMALIKTEGGQKLWRGYDIHDQAIRSGSNRFSRSSYYDGRLYQQFDGFTLILRTHYNNMMNITYFEYGMEWMPDYYSGISVITRRRLPEANRLASTVMRKLSDNFSEWITCARQCGSMEMDNLQPEVKNVLMRIPDFV